jgi:hypothetical protein
MPIPPLTNSLSDYDLPSPGKCPGKAEEEKACVYRWRYNRGGINLR